MSAAKTNQVNEIQLSYKKKKLPFEVQKITASDNVSALAREIYKRDKCQMELKEYFYAIFFNRNNHVIGYLKVSEGGITGTVADIRLIMSAALKSLSSFVIILHNHPSGNLKPSQADKVLTNKFKEAGKILDIPLLDHIILTDESHFSFADEGLL